MRKEVRYIMKEQKTIYSNHTFIFPFVFDDKNLDRKNFASNLPSFMKKDKSVFANTTNNKDNPLDIWEINQFIYFNNAAKNAIYTYDFDDNDVVWNYACDINELASINNVSFNDDALINISAPNFFATLKVVSIRLKLFNTGIGLLIFTLENDSLKDERDVIKINEFGRRIYMAYLNQEKKCGLCADEISLIIGEKKIIDGSFNGQLGDFNDEIVLSKIITDFLSNGSRILTTSTQKFNSNPKLYRIIEPIIDDRMFVACIYNNPEFVETMGTWENGNYRYISDADNYSITDENNAARRFYEMIFVDGDGITCYDREMIKKLNKEHSYTRWLNYGKPDFPNLGTKDGTITGITEYSMICVTGSFSFNQNPFLWEYIEMVALVVAQRASLLLFAKQVSYFASNKSYKISKTHENYIKCESELLFQEVTPQQQGIELYNMMIKNMYINELKIKVEDQIESLNTYNSGKEERLESIFLLILAGLGAVNIADAFGNAFNWSYRGYVDVFVAGIAIIVALLLRFFRKGRH